MAKKTSSWGNDLYSGRKSYAIVPRRKTWITIGVITVLLSIAVVALKGLNFGIEFTGGTQFVLERVSSQSESEAHDILAERGNDDQAKVARIGESGLRIQTVELSDTEQADLSSTFAQAYGIDENQDITISQVGPSWGASVLQKALLGVGVFLVLAMIAMTIYFRAWRMALAAILPIFHDLALTIGVYSLVGWEVTPATVIGLLTILGYSIYDKVVVFDKMRENTEDITGQTRYTYAEASNLAVNQTLVRSINTSIVGILPIAAILFIGVFILGAGTLRDIALALFVGMIAGAYSSIFLGATIEVALRDTEPRIVEHTKKVTAAREQRTDGETVGADSGYNPAAKLIPGQHLGVRAQPRRKR